MIWIGWGWLYLLFESGISFYDCNLLWGDKSLLGNVATFKYVVNITIITFIAKRIRNKTNIRKNG